MRTAVAHSTTSAVLSPGLLLASMLRPHEADAHNSLRTAWRGCAQAMRGRSVAETHSLWCDALRQHRLRALGLTLAEDSTEGCAQGWPRQAHVTLGAAVLRQAR